MMRCCYLHLLPSYYERHPDSEEDQFNVIRYKRTRRIRCGTIILDFERKKILIIQSYKRFWGLPKGHMEEGETPEQCAIRETLEETGIELGTEQLLRSYSVFQGDGIYFIVNGNALAYNLWQITSKEEITGITWICLPCLQHFIGQKEMLINSHFRTLLPIIEKELCKPES